MKIEVIGSGCPKCKALYEKVLELKKQGKIDGEIIYVKDINELINRGVMGSPALFVDGILVCTGIPSEETLKKALNIK